ncbi:metallophosphoesterase [Mucilaginibacter aquatilis]|uniref:Metallophosphoesterase n=1 Tax=Mucilaginibacter aquatilis TaxID=1517760 RepID=A0A6I4IDV9_9SPHI|nr:metallophosphoesterase [Mucilaginibacter aquatilis]MVN91786.1 metallophosphoesterase [Mucilaginibacter aquatilis]
MKQVFWILLAGLFSGISHCVTAQPSHPTVDGPYIFYKGDYGYAKRIEKKGKKLKLKIDSFKVSDRADTKFRVDVDGYPDWSFTVKLKKKISPRSASFSGSEPMLFLSDIEGEFTAFREILLANNVIDSNYNWLFGKGRLVIAGDLFDRGKQVTPYLWLLYKLEDDARAKGGDVNVILGNHDIMNFKGDYRYVQPLYWANAKLMHESYSDLHNADTELGRWLRSKNIIEKIGDMLVMHGGMSADALEQKLTVDEINNASRPYLDKSSKVTPDILKSFLGNQGVFWYRGYFTKSRASMQTVDATLKQYKVKYIVVGHTIIKQNIGLYYGGKVVGLDVNEHKGDRAAALYTKGKWYVLDASGNKKELIYNEDNDTIKTEDID